MKPSHTHILAIGVDLGGTAIKVAAVDGASGRRLAERIVPTRDGEREDGGPAFVAETRRAVDALERELQVRHLPVGVSAPGVARPDGSAIAFMPGRLHGLERLDWTAALGRPDPVPVLNDAQAALLGEIAAGAARGLRNVILLTLGTGVGGAAVCDGHLLRGHLGRAGHLGHLTVDSEGPPDICNTPGSLEDAIGNATLPERTGGRWATTHDLIAAYRRGNPDAAAIWMTSLRALAAAIVSLINILDPEAVVIGGGIAAAGPALFEPLEPLVRAREWTPAGARVALLPATLGVWAGVHGAAANALNPENQGAGNRPAAPPPPPSNPE